MLQNQYGVRGLGNTTLTLTVPQGSGDLTFWTAQTDGTQLIPDANGVLETFTMPSSGTFDGTVWVSVAPGSDPADFPERLATGLLGGRPGYSDQQGDAGPNEGESEGLLF